METTIPSPETEFISILGADKAEMPPRISSRSLPENLPILGLADIVIFPGAVVPLLVETGPSLKLIDDVVAGDRLLGAVLQRRADVVEPGPDDLHTIGCVSRLSKMVKFPDGSVRLLVEGLWRIRVKNYLPAAPYLRAGYELLRDETEDSVELQAMLRNAHKQFEDIARLSTALSEQVKIAGINVMRIDESFAGFASSCPAILDAGQALLIKRNRSLRKTLLPQDSRVIDGRCAE